LAQGDTLTFAALAEQIAVGPAVAVRSGDGRTFDLKLEVTPRERESILAGGLLNLAGQGRHAWG
jgi:hypothetical protein